MPAASVPTSPLIVRPADEADRPAIRQLHLAAFESDVEATLVDVLDAEADPVVSLVALERGELVGHILFSPATLLGPPELKCMALAPMAVRPDRQRQGIGSLLVRRGLACCRELDTSAVIVLGHPDYYPRFGFEVAARRGLHCEYDVPPEYFMVLELRPGALAGVSGVFRYHDAFRAV